MVPVRAWVVCLAEPMEVVVIEVTVFRGARYLFPSPRGGVIMAIRRTGRPPVVPPDGADAPVGGAEGTEGAVR
ncbi:hypothetical protein SUDANB6_05236 [Streptomyces sp. enrichment culture]